MRYKSEGIEENDIFVRIDKYEVFDKDPIYNEFIGFKFPRDVNRVTIEITNPEWILLGSLESIREGIVDFPWETEIMQFPLRITLKYFILQDIIETGVNYWKISPY